MKYYSVPGAKTSRWKNHTTSSAPAWSLRSLPSLLPTASSFSCLCCDGFSALDRGFFRSVMSLSLPLCPEQITLQWKQHRYWRSARPQFSNPSCTLESPGGGFNTLPDGLLTSVLYTTLIFFISAGGEEKFTESGSRLLCGIVDTPYSGVVSWAPSLIRRKKLCFWKLSRYVGRCAV